MRLGDTYSMVAARLVQLTDLLIARGSTGPNC